MKALHYQAVVGHPAAAPAVMHQAAEALRPFRRYLGQAVHTAKQRQVRYQLAWTRVRDLRTVRLEAVDTVLEVPMRTPAAVLTSWPRGLPFRLGEKAFVKNRGIPVEVDSANEGESGLRIRTVPAVRTGDVVIWCGVESLVQEEERPAAPREVRDADGRRLILRVQPREHDDGESWRLVVEGKVQDGMVVMDGEETTARVLNAFEGLHQLSDAGNRRYDTNGPWLRTDRLPSPGLLEGDNGVRYRWAESGGNGRDGCWVELLAPEVTESDDFLDPRAAFCEGDVREVWTEPKHRKESVFKVKRVDQDRYQLLLDRYPPEGSRLYLPVNLRNLHLQRRALRQLEVAPLPHHQGLLRLCEDPAKVRWPAVRDAAIAHDAWRALTDVSRSGTDEQRAFVSKALGTPDFAFLEGPPGSGKTTAICEIIQQLAARGQRVLLCASTHVAIDNVLERLLDAGGSIDAVRIGNVDDVDEKVRSAQLDERVRAVLAGWKGRPAMARYGTAELEEMAERAVIMAANLTCGTTMGIVNHPVFRGRDEDLHFSERPIASMPHWDVLIVDEASKTLVQEFLVPALMAKKWIVVGDVRQLPPFADRNDLVANLRDLVDERDRPLFPPDHQRAQLLLFRLLRDDVLQEGMRWLLVEPPGVCDWITRELEAAPYDGLVVVRIVAKGAKPSDAVMHVTVEQLRSGASEALLAAAADWLVVGDDVIGQVDGLLPAHHLLANEFLGPNAPLSATSPLRTRQAHWLHGAGRLESPFHDRSSRAKSVETFRDAQACERDWLSRHDLAQEIAWRLTRSHELRHSENQRERKRIKKDLEKILPAAADVTGPISEIEDVGLPSVLEVLQEGIGEDRSKRRSALTTGLKPSHPQAFESRFTSLTYQHRMHPEIAVFPREVIYAGSALRDANTLEKRDGMLDWDFGPYPSRSVWVPVRGREQGSVNQDEIRAMEEIVRAFIDWARRKGPPAGTSRPWEAACLCFYAKQESAIAEMLRRVTEDDRRTRFRARDAPAEIVCGTVDRFQGREADLVLLSLRNTRRIGFLDSPNRLNVAVTRARQQFVVLGNRDYFLDCGVQELWDLARRTTRMPATGSRGEGQTHR